MRFYPTRTSIAFLCFIVSTISLNVGCSKDSDLLIDSVLEDTSTAIEERTLDNGETEASEELENVATVEENTTVSFETRTTSFSPSNDAHIQSGKGYNQRIIRLEEAQRPGFLMFDLSPINAVNGTIASATLQFTINSDDGSGKVAVFKGSSNEWTENNLSESTAPETEVELGSIIKEYEIGATESIVLSPELILSDVYTLILNHSGGNDLAFASKEHASGIGPKLVISYEVREGSNEIVIVDETNGQETSEEVTTPEETTSEEVTTPEESTSEEPSTTNEEPMAVADATPSSGGVPLVVTFKGSNSSDDNGIIGYSWDFKDGATDTSANPSHTYTKAGTYQATLTVVDAEGLSTTDTVTITVTEDQNEAPKAMVSATPVSGEAPLEVTFTGSDSTDDHSIASYGWDFKDGSKTNVADFKYTYTTPGSYAAELTVTDENGLSNKKSITITVTASQNEAPVANATANITSGSTPLNVQFTGDKSTDDVGITSYAWNFKDGATATTANPSHTFTQAGTYQVELTVRDKDGLSSKKSLTITTTAPTPQNQSPAAVVSANPTSGEAPLNVQFTGTNSTDDKAITSYHWNFKDGATSTSSSPSHTFNSAGSFVVELTVKDAEGASSSKSITITVTEPIVANVPDGYYVSTSGNSSNDGKSPSKPWSIEHAFLTAEPGDIVYIKAGNYSNKQVVNYKHANSSNPIKFIGYDNTPGDISSTFDYGDQLDAAKMPLLKGSSSNSGTGIDINGNYVEVHNIQLTNYQLGVITKGSNVVLKNIIITNIGEQNNNNQQNGKGMHIYGNNTIVEDSFVLNANSEGINIKGANGCKIKNTKVYSNNTKNPTGYYILIAGNNNIIDNCVVYRAPQADLHQGHGIVIKNQGSGNVIKGCSTYNTGFEVNFSGVSNNTFQDSKIYGKNTSYNGQYSSNIAILNGAHHNTFKYIYIEDTNEAIKFRDFDDGLSGSGDLNEGGHDNNFINISVNKADNIIAATSAVVGASAKSYNNTFTNCSFKNIKETPFYSYQRVTNTKFSNCIFENIPNNTMLNLYAGGSFQMSFTNCTFNNVGFPKPN